MKQHEKTQIAAVVPNAQAEAIARVSKLRGISKQALIREGIEAVTGVKSEIPAYPPGEPRGFSDPGHPYFQKRKARAKRDGAKRASSRR